MILLLVVVLIISAVIAFLYFKNQQEAAVPAPSVKRAPSTDPQYYKPGAYVEWDPASAMRALDALDPSKVGGSDGSGLKIPSAPKPPPIPKSAPIKQPGSPVFTDCAYGSGPWSNNSGFIDPNALWIGGAPGHASGGPLNMQWSFYKVIYNDGETTMRAHIIVDDIGVFEVDGVKIGDIAGGWWGNYPKFDVPLSPGFHLLKLTAVNVGGGPNGICATFIDQRSGKSLARTDRTWTFTQP
jgi:hypothetical protein